MFRRENGFRIVFNRLHKIRQRTALREVRRVGGFRPCHRSDPTTHADGGRIDIDFRSRPHVRMHLEGDNALFTKDFQRRTTGRDLCETCIDEADAVVAEIERYIIGVRHVIRADDFAVERSRTASALLAGGRGQTIDGFGGAHDTSHFV